MLKNISVKAKLSLLVSIALISILLISWRGLSATSSINDSLNQIVNVNVNRIQVSQQMTIALIAMQRAEKNIILAHTDEEMDKHEKSFYKFQAKFKEYGEKARNLVGERGRAKVERCIAIGTTDYLQTAEKVMVLTRAGKNEEAFQMSTVGRKYVDECEGLMDEWSQDNDSDLTKMSKETDETYIFARNLVIGLSSLALIGLMTIAFLVTNIITGSVASVQKGLVSFFRFLNRETDKAERIDLDSKDEFGQMAHVINTNIDAIEKGLVADANAVANSVDVANKVKAGYLNEQITATPNNPQLVELRDVLNDMLQTTAERVANDLNDTERVLKSFAAYDFTAQVANAKGQIDVSINNLGSVISSMLSNSLQNGIDLQGDASSLKQAVESLSTASNEQAASLEETAAAMEEMTSNVQNNAQKANDMASMASQTDASAKQGAELAHRTSTAMTEIQEATNSINNAVAIIENIAFQTNILSLNAAVEAATAGEAGKGFAVVAQEVRNLANRSADAAKEIKALAEQAASKSSEGMNIANDLTRGFEDIASKIEQTTMLVQDVSNASREQMQGIGQINTAITQLDQMTQENAKVAAEADNIANATISKATAMVDDASSKNFVGKDRIHVSSHTQRTPARTAQNTVRPMATAHAAAKKQTAPAPLAKHTDDDVWESF